MIVIDAGVVIAAWNPADAHFVAARALFDQHPDVAIHPVNLGEALVHPIARGEEARARAALRAMQVHEAQVGADHGFALARARAETGLKMPDCCALVAAEDARAPLATFDRRLADAARARGVVVLP